MKRTSLILMVVGLIVGFAVGYIVHSERPAVFDTAPQTAEAPRDQTVSSREQELLLQSIELLDQTTAELEAARNRLGRFERVAKRYDWLKQNGVQTHSLSFDESTFEPRPHLMEFLDLNETEAERFSSMSTKALTEVQAWEQSHARCTIDNATNCVYEITPLPVEFKDNFLNELGKFLPSDDVEFLNTIVDKLYDPLAGKREVSLTFIDKDVYAEKHLAQNPNSHPPDSDMMTLMVKRYDEDGNSRGSWSSTFGADNVQWMESRWAHLFTFSGDSE